MLSGQAQPQLHIIGIALDRAVKDFENFFVATALNLQQVMQVDEWFRIRGELVSRGSQQPLGFREVTRVAERAGKI